MSRSRRSWWAIYAACAAAVIGALVWITGLVVDLESARRTAAAEASHQETLRLALWRMDSWVAPLLAREAARPYFEYLPYYPHERAYTRILNRIEAGEVFTPSPLLTFRSEYFRLHFQIDPSGSISSPQVPTGNLRDLAEATVLPGSTIDANAEELRRIGKTLDPEALRRTVTRGEAQAEAGDLGVAPTVVPDDVDPAQLAAQNEWSFRSNVAKKMVQRQEVMEVVRVGDAGPGASTGPLVPAWFAGPGKGTTLLFVRRMRVGPEEFFQGFVVDWPRLRAGLLDQVSDLFPAANVLPVRAVDADLSRRLLAAVPVALEVPPPQSPENSLWNPLRATLGIMWLAVLSAIAAAGITLRASISYGEKRSRFASAVTHELRTPLTTFRLYSEMLADGMVPDEAKRRSYIETLRRESGRLAALVENVLAYARLEDGRRPSRPERISVGTLFDRIVPPLARRAEEAGFVLSVETEGVRETAVHVDPDAAGQVLFNLVDNACKYAGAAGERTIHLTATAGADGPLDVRVRDHGPGIPANRRREIFRPFERAGRDESDATPGVGLGLALARGLARDMGGDLTSEPRPDGACFRLRVPRERVGG